MQNGTSILEVSLAISYKIIQFLPYDPAIALFGIYLPKLFKN